MSTYGQLDEFLRQHGVRYFTAREMSRHVVPPRGLWSNSLPTVHVARLLRQKFGRLAVNSGYRDPEHNARIGGAPGSLHLKFNALDLRPLDGPTPEDLWFEILSKGWNRMMGIGLYTGFIHIDTRALLYGMPHRFWDLRRNQ